MLAALFFMSCQNQDYIVKLPNGSLLPAKRADNVRIDYPLGTKVCVRQTAGLDHNWYICTDGELQDTLYFNQYHDSTMSIVEHKVGIINAFYYPIHP